MKKVIILILVLLVLAFAFYKYFTRPIKMRDVQIDPAVNVSESDIVYSVDKENSEIRFEIDEILRGNPFTVVGKTNEINGSLILKNGNLDKDSIVISDIYVDARTFKTDNPQRDNAIVRSIVKSENEGQEFAKITNITVQKFEQDREDQNKFDLDLMGDLFLNGKTKRISFDLDLYKGIDSFVAEIDADLNRKDFDLVIPSIPFVAGVPNEFEIEGRIVLKP